MHVCVVKGTVIINVHPCIHRPPRGVGHDKYAGNVCSCVVVVVCGGSVLLACGWCRRACMGVTSIADGW